MLDLLGCKMKTDSKASRNLVFALPVERYLVEPPENFTLQAMFGALVQDLNKLASDGIIVDGKDPL